MHIAHLIHLDRVGGVETLFIDYLIRSSQRGEVEHSVLIVGEEVHPRFRSSVESLATWYGFTKRWGPVKLPKFPSMIRRNHVRQKTKTIKPNLCLAWNVLDLPDGFEISHEISMVYYEHGASAMERESEDLPSTLHMATAYLFNSEAMHFRFRDRWGQDRTGPVIPLPVGSKAYSSQEKMVKLAQELPTMGTAGRLLPIKGMGLALHALRSLHQLGFQARWKFAGVGPLEEELRNLAKSLDVEDSVEFLGSVEDMASFYGDIDLFVCPSIREPLGLVCLEALASGVAVLAAEVDGLPEVVRDGETGHLIEPTEPLQNLVQWGLSAKGIPDTSFHPKLNKMMPSNFVHPQKLAESIVELWTDEALRQKVACNGPKLVLKERNLEVYVHRIEDFLKGIMARKSINEA